MVINGERLGNCYRAELPLLPPLHVYPPLSPSHPVTTQSFSFSFRLLSPLHSLSCVFVYAYAREYYLYVYRGLLNLFIYFFFSFLYISSSLYMYIYLWCIYRTTLSIIFSFVSLFLSVKLHSSLVVITLSLRLPRARS